MAKQRRLGYRGGADSEAVRVVNFTGFAGLSECGVRGLV